MVIPFTKMGALKEGRVGNVGEVMSSILDMLCLRCLCEHVQEAAGHTELDMGRRVTDVGLTAATTIRSLQLEWEDEDRKLCSLKSVI